MLKKITQRIFILNAEAKGYSPEAHLILNSFAEVDYCDLDYEGLKLQLKSRPYQCLIVRLRNFIGKDILDSATNLKVIASATTGLDHIDLEECSRRHIKVISLREGANFLREVYATAEHTWALVLSLIRNIAYAHFSVLHGEWNRDKFIGFELYGKTLGVIGLGRIGNMVANYARAFGMQVLAFTKTAKEMNGGVKLVTLNDLLQLSDVISIHLPLNKETIHFISKPEFRLMKRTPYLVNTSRGEIINELDLLWALEEGLIKGAALDVLDGERKEGFIFENPLIEYAKRNKNLIITPHIGGATKESMAKTEVFIAEKIKESF